jgi:hypothetical protein
MVSSVSDMRAHEQEVRIREGNYGNLPSLVVYIPMNFLWKTNSSLTKVIYGMVESRFFQISMVRV